MNIQKALNTLERDKNEIIKKYNSCRKHDTRHKYSIVLYKIDASIEAYRKQLEENKK